MNIVNFSRKRTFVFAFMCCMLHTSAGHCLDIQEKLLQFACKHSSQEDLKLFIDEANRGNTDMQTILGLYYYSCGPEQEAVKWLQKSAEKNDSTSLFFLGTAYSSGQGVVQDRQKGCQLFKKAVEYGKKSDFLPAAEFKLAECHYLGTGVEMNKARSEQLLRSSSKHFPEAKFFLATILLSNEKGVTHDERESVKLLKEASKEGLALASYVLSQMYANGKIVKKNEVEADRYLKLSEKQGQGESKADLEKMKKAISERTKKASKQTSK